MLVVLVPQELATVSQNLQVREFRSISFRCRPVRSPFASFLRFRFHVSPFFVICLKILRIESCHTNQVPGPGGLRP